MPPEMTLNAHRSNEQFCLHLATIVSRPLISNQAHAKKGGVAIRILTVICSYVPPNNDRQPPQRVLKRLRPRPSLQRSSSLQNLSDQWLVRTAERIAGEDMWHADDRLSLTVGHEACYVKPSGKLRNWQALRQELFRCAPQR